MLLATYILCSKLCWLVPNTYPGVHIMTQRLPDSFTGSGRCIVNCRLLFHATVLIMSSLRVLSGLMNACIPYACMYAREMKKFEGPREEMPIWCTIKLIVEKPASFS